MNWMRQRKKLLITLFVMGMVLIALGVSGAFLNRSDEDNHGVYSDVPVEIAREVEHTTFVEPLEPLEPEYSEGIKGMFERVSDHLGVPTSLFSILFGVVIILSITLSVIYMTSNYVIGVTSGFGVGLALISVGILPWIFLIVFMFMFISYIVIDAKRMIM